MRYVFCFLALTVTFIGVFVQRAAAESATEVFSAAIAPDGKHIALGHKGAVSLESTEASETRRIRIENKDGIEDTNATVNTLAFSYGGQPGMLALGTSAGAVYLHEITTQHQKAQLLGTHDWGIVGIAIAAHRKLVVSASEEGNIKFWNVQTKQEIYSLDETHNFKTPGNITAVALSSDGTTLALGATANVSLKNDTLQVWEISRDSLDKKGPKRKIGIPKQTSVTALAFSPDNKWLAAGAADGTLFLVDMTKLASRLTTITQKNFAVTTLAFSPDSQIVVVGTEDGEVSFWDPYTAAKKKAIKPVDTAHSQHDTEVLAVAFSDGGKRLTSIDTTRATVSWNLPLRSTTNVVEKPSQETSVTIDAKTEKGEDSNRVHPAGTSAQIEIVSPELEADNSIKIWTGRLTVKARIVHQTGIETVTIGRITTEEMLPSQESADLFTGTISFRDYGRNTFNIVAIPKNGKRTVRRVAVNFLKDEINPQITISRLTDKSVTGRVTDQESGVNLNTVKIGQQKIVLEPDGSFTYTPTLKEGDNTFTITATDKVGNPANSEFVIHRPTQPSSVTTALTPPPAPVQQPSNTAAAPVPTTTPVSSLKIPAQQTTPGSIPLSETPTTAPAPTQRDADDPRITFINHELDKGRFYTTTAERFLLEVYVLDQSQIPVDGVKIERKVGGSESRTYAFIINAATEAGDKYVASLPLDIGTNAFRITAEDEWSNIERQPFTIVRAQADREGPRIEVTQVGEQTLHFPGEVVTVSDEEIRVRGRINDRSGIRSVTVNGVATFVDNGSFETNVPLDYGENTITIRATDLRKQASETVMSVYQRPDRVGKDFALFFPTNTYSGAKDADGNWKDLKSTLRDAALIAANLRDNYGFETKIFENYTRKQVLDTIYTYRDGFDGITYEEGSQLLIFFSGHGHYDNRTGIGYLIAADTDGVGVDPTQTSAIDHGTLRTHINAIACRRILVLLDTCSSGPFDPNFLQTELPGFRNLTSNSLLEQVNIKLRLDARWCLTAAGKEYVIDGGDRNNSPFAKAFLNALNSKGGNDSLLNLDEVWSEVYKSREAPVYQKYIGVLVDEFPEPRKGQFGTNIFKESDFLFFPIR